MDTLSLMVLLERISERMKEYNILERIYEWMIDHHSHHHHWKAGRYGYIWWWWWRWLSWLQNMPRKVYNSIQQREWLNIFTLSFHGSAYIIWIVWTRIRTLRGVRLNQKSFIKRKSFIYLLTITVNEDILIFITTNDSIKWISIFHICILMKFCFAIFIKRNAFHSFVMNVIHMKYYNQDLKQKNKKWKFCSLQSFSGLNRNIEHLRCLLSHISHQTGLWTFVV